MRFTEAQLDRIRRVSPSLSVACAEADAADYSTVEVLYAGLPPRDLGRAPALKWVQLHMAGVNALHDHPLYTASALPLTTTSGVHAGTIAEYALTVLLALAHRVPRMVEWHARGGWPPDPQRWPLFVPTEVRGATLGIIGYGSIGRELARMATSAFGMRVIALKRNPSQRADPDYCPPGTGDPEGRLPETWLGPERLTELLERSDVVVMAAPLTPETQRMIGARELARMKPSAYFVNVGRGATVDEAALVDALERGALGGAALDVFEEEPLPATSPLWTLPSVIVSPHICGDFDGWERAVVDVFLENLGRFVRGETLRNQVDAEAGFGIG